MSYVKMVEKLTKMVEKLLQRGDIVSEPITISFVGTNELKLWLEQQAQADDRSISYILRRILEKESQKVESRKQTTSQQ